MYENLSKTIEVLAGISVSAERKLVLQPLIDYIKNKVENSQAINLNFICTHNSRRSHLGQIWAQTMASYFNLKYVNCYSGGTEATAMFSKISETLQNQGFNVFKLSQESNPVFAIKFAENEPAIICFSKIFDDVFNPSSNFAAVLTCNSADEACPFIAGAEARIPVKYNDPKVFDGTDLMNEKYAERSLEIASEMYFVFSKSLK